MAHIPIWPGSSSFSAGIAAFGFYDKDKDFQVDAPLVQHLKKLLLNMVPKFTNFKLLII
jgi:hypothetical protein